MCTIDQSSRMATFRSETTVTNDEVSHRHAARDAIFACYRLSYRLLLCCTGMRRVTVHDNWSLRIMQIVTLI